MRPRSQPTQRRLSHVVWLPILCCIAGVPRHSRSRTRRRHVSSTASPTTDFPASACCQRRSAVQRDAHRLLDGAHRCALHLRRGRRYVREMPERRAAGPEPGSLSVAACPARARQRVVVNGNYNFARGGDIAIVDLAQPVYRHFSGGLQSRREAADRNRGTLVGYGRTGGDPNSSRTSASSASPPSRPHGVRLRRGIFPPFRPPTTCASIWSRRAIRAPVTATREVRSSPTSVTAAPWLGSLRASRATRWTARRAPRIFTPTSSATAASSPISSAVIPPMRAAICPRSEHRDLVHGVESALRLPAGRSAPRSRFPPARACCA